MTALGTHAGQLERWLGKAALDDISRQMKDWYGPPIALGGVPGKVYATRGGDFRGRIAAGTASTALCLSEDFVTRLSGVFRRWSARQAHTLNTGFSSLSDLISEATVGGKRREFAFNKAGAAATTSASNSLWRVGNHPAAGGAASAAPGGTAFTSASTGAFSFDNPSGGDTQHFVSANVVTQAAGNTLMLYDRLFGVAKTMNSNATEAVSGVPTRYQSTTPGAQDSAAGNFLFFEVGTVLPATAHNWTVCTYLDQGGNASTLPSVAGIPSAAATRLDLPLSTWFAPLESGDTGIKALTQLQLSAAVASGAVDAVIGHPLAWMPIPIANMACVIDGINTAFNLVRIFDDACLAFLEICKPSTTVSNYTGTFTTVRG